MTEEQKNEYLDLLAWFDIYYTQHEQKYRRLIALGKMCDNGTNPQDNLQQLYIQAEEKRKKIIEIEKNA